MLFLQYHSIWVGVISWQCGMILKKEYGVVKRICMLQKTSRYILLNAFFLHMSISNLIIGLVLNPLFYPVIKTKVVVLPAIAVKNVFMSALMNQVKFKCSLFSISVVKKLAFPLLSSWFMYFAQSSVRVL